MALVTNGIAHVQHSRLDRSGLRPLFETVVISSEIGHAKPHAGFFDETFRRIGGPPRETVLMVGDNLGVDIKGGADYGTATCWINPRRHPRDEAIRVDHELEAVHQLAALLD
jgi:FMN phosphatase YigB (HAD superfamily)